MPLKLIESEGVAIGDVGRRPRSLVHEAYDHIKRMILIGELKSGDRISEKAIATRLEVSRTPIREALKMLEQYGVIEFKPRSYAKVSSITRDEMVKLAQVRIEIERLAARTLLSRPELFRPEILLDKADRAIRELMRENLADCYLFDSAFHLELARQSDNGILLDVMERLDSKSQLVRVASQTQPKHYLLQLREHLELVRLLKAGAEDEVMRLIHQHITPRSWASRRFCAGE